MFIQYNDNNTLSTINFIQYKHSLLTDLGLTVLSWLMNEINRMESLEFHLKVKNLFQKVKQISWNIKQLEANFKEPEFMTNEEIDRLTAFYLAMGIDLEDIAKDSKTLLKLWKEKSGK